MAKLFATVNAASDEIVLERNNPNAPWTLPGGAPLDLVRTGPSTFSLVHNGRSHRVLVLKEDREHNTVRMRIGGHTYTVKLQDEQSRLMKTLGLDKAAQKVTDIKAPMPGLVRRIDVAPGQEIKEGDPILILEAMKMENVLKSPGEGRIAKVLVSEGAPVEKGQVLVEVE